jgi:four helix bundle protein
MRDPHKLEVFRLAHELAVLIYRVTDSLPAAERFGLQAQLRRAAVSIPANLVEGCARRHARDYCRFVEIALGSAAELRYLLELVEDLGLTKSSDSRVCKDRSDHVFRALHQLIEAIGRFPVAVSRKP